MQQLIDFYDEINQKYAAMVAKNDMLPPDTETAAEKLAKGNPNLCSCTRKMAGEFLKTFFKCVRFKNR